MITASPSVASELTHRTWVLLACWVEGVLLCAEAESESFDWLG